MDIYLQFIVGNANVFYLLSMIKQLFIAHAACERNCAAGKANLFRDKTVLKRVSKYRHTFLMEGLMCMLLMKVWKIPWYHQYVCIIKVIRYVWICSSFRWPCLGYNVAVCKDAKMKLCDGFSLEISEGCEVQRAQEMQEYKAVNMV